LRRKICKNYYEKKERGVTAGQALWHYMKTSVFVTCNESSFLILPCVS
jgi:hypothetical protein